MTATLTATPTDAFRVAVDAIAGDDLLLDLTRVARLFNMPSRESVRYRILRGTLPLRTVQPGGQTAALLVPAADVYELLGLTWEPPASQPHSDHPGAARIAAAASA